ncbi:hypothetical protein CR164_04910 [Prosthecochloris marina]|uniref:Glycosyl transferase family 1 domain-containing protein n=1 Tax=Prosthecochloris marina TaxID=2017681 RepID=A0A317T9D2_9CHLB|nr:hypothetical protein CR164_04910 [Prosthecochloris marina]
MRRRIPTSELFIAYKKKLIRKELIANPSNRPENYLLWGLESYASKGFTVKHNLDRQETTLETRINKTINKFLKILGVPGGDWLTILKNHKSINKSDVMLSTVDNVGIPAVILKRIGLIKTPIIYVSVGLPEQIDKIKTRVLRKFYLNSLRNTKHFICYSIVEKERLKSLLHTGDEKVSFIPLGIMTSFFNPLLEVNKQWDIVSIGADPMRDYALLAQFAVKHKKLKILIVTSANHSYIKHNKPGNLDCEFNISLDEAIKRFSAGKLIVLPVKENTYTGATTTLLQAMCMQKCVIVSNVGPIKKGYNLVSNENCILVEPGNYTDLEASILSALSNDELLEQTGINGRRTVLEHNTWESFISKTSALILEVINPH